MEEIFKNSKRIHDDFYLNENLKVKESFKFLLNEIKNNFDGNFSLIDIGCATGVFLSHVYQQIPSAKLYGADIMSSLLKETKKNCPSSTLFELNINDTKSVKNNLGNKKFDIVVLDGVHPIFDNVNPWASNLMELVSENGAIYIFGSFNEENYDVVTRVKLAGSDVWEQGWNRFSLATVRKEFEKNNFKVKTKKFNIHIDIKKSDDPRRTYTQKLKNGENLTRNGLELISTPYLIECKK